MNVTFKPLYTHAGTNGYLATLMGGEWPSDAALIAAADGGGEYSGYFGGRVRSALDLPEEPMKVVIVYTS